MNKLVYSLRRLPHLSRVEFQRYWREVHAPLVHERAAVLGIVRYVQCHTRDDLDSTHDAYRARNGGAPEPFDGFAELWFTPRRPSPSTDTSLREAAEQASADTSWREAAERASAELLADERNFIDLVNSPMSLTTEHPIVVRERRVLVTTTDHDATVAWHRALFDWPVARSWADGSVGSLLIIDAATRIEILQDSVEVPASPVAGTAVIVEVPSVDEIHRRAVDLGATITQPPQNTPWGHRNLMLTDPNGLTVVAFELL